MPIRRPRRWLATRRSRRESIRPCCDASASRPACERCAEADLWSVSCPNLGMASRSSSIPMSRRSCARGSSQFLPDGRSALDVAFDTPVPQNLRPASLRLEEARGWRCAARGAAAAIERFHGDRRNGRQRATRPRDVALGPARDATHAGHRARHRRCRRDDPGRHRVSIRRRRSRTGDPAASADLS